MLERNVELMAHLLRRAGFGANRAELEAYAAKGYEATVEELLNPAEERRLSDYLVRRFHPELSGMMGPQAPGENWLYRMATTNAPLQEKLTLFWHGIFATGYAKVIHGKALSDQTRMFRKHGMGSFRTLLLELSRDPAMIIWLDNQDNHKDAINENYGRELLELFSMGVGNYTEQGHQGVRPGLYRLGPSPTGSTWNCGRSGIRTGPMAGFPGTLSFTRKTTTTGKRSFWGSGGTSTARTSLT